MKLSKPRLTKPQLGANFDTDWARKWPFRIIRMAMIETISRPLVKAVAPPTVFGRKRLDGIEQPVIFAANHSSHLDTSLVLTCLPARFRHHSVVAAGADYFFDKWRKAVLWSLWINIIPIEREKVGRRSAELSARLLSEGWNLVIFPEGTRSRDGAMAPFRGGAAYLGIRCNVPVVPIHLEGTHRVFGVGARRVSPGPTKMTIGEPLWAKEGERGKDFNIRIQDAVVAAAGEFRDQWVASAPATAAEDQAPKGRLAKAKAWFDGQRKARRSRRRWPR
jgi:1-acyl-sn-glycerol-3-phosphate acyltransferase